MAPTTSSMLAVAVLLAACVLASSAAAASAPQRFGFFGRVVPPEGVEGRPLFANLRVVLNGGQYTSFVNGEGYFEFEDLAVSSYSLEVVSTAFVFEPLRVDVQSAKQIKVYKANIVPTNNVPVPYSVTSGLELRPVAMAKYFEERQGFNILDILKNPMVLMMGLPLLLTFLLPKMTEGMDKEQLESMQRGGIMNTQNQQQQMPDISSFLADYTSGGKKTKPAAGSGKDKEKAGK